ncbi:MAG: hypothetical protein WBV94_30975, partial [Blastocatellia bacterium]
YKPCKGDINHLVYFALTGLVRWWQSYPARCAGLLNFALSGLLLRLLCRTRVRFTKEITTAQAGS